MTLLDKRIETDLKERLADVKDAHISAAANLAPLAKDGDGFRFSTKGMPTYFTGNRDAKTVFVQLNPGMDADIADARWDFDTKHFDPKKIGIDKFIEDYVESRRDYGKNDRLRFDAFDVKQAAFLYHWDNSGISFPANVDWTTKTKNDKPEKEISWLDCKEHVLMEKLQLELIPYASQQFEINNKKLNLLLPYVEMLLEEIFRVDRTYVIFGGNDFEDLFRLYEKIHPGSIEVITRKPIPLTGRTKNSNCTVLKITYNGKTQKAVIAHTFPLKTLHSAFNTMQEYGKACYEAFNAAKFK